MKELRKAQERDPRDQVTLLTLGVQIAVHGTLQEAERHFDSVMKLRPQPAEAVNHYRNRGLAYMVHLKADKAVADFRKCLQLNPSDMSAALYMGTTLKDLKQDFVAAKEAFEQATGINPRLPQAHHGLADALSALGDWANALKEYDLVLTMMG